MTTTVEILSTSSLTSHALSTNIYESKWRSKGFFAGKERTIIRYHNNSERPKILEVIQETITFWQKLLSALFRYQPKPISSIQATKIESKEQIGAIFKKVLDDQSSDALVEQIFPTPLVKSAELTSNAIQQAPLIYEESPSAIQISPQEIIDTSPINVSTKTENSFSRLMQHVSLLGKKIKSELSSFKEELTRDRLAMLSLMMCGIYARHYYRSYLMQSYSKDIALREDSILSNNQDPFSKVYKYKPLNNSFCPLKSDPKKIKNSKNPKPKLISNTENNPKGTLSSLQENSTNAGSRLVSNTEDNSNDEHRSTQDESKDALKSSNDGLLETIGLMGMITLGLINSRRNRSVKTPDSPNTSSLAPKISSKEALLAQASASLVTDSKRTTPDHIDPEASLDSDMPDVECPALTASEVEAYTLHAHLTLPNANLNYYKENFKTAPVVCLVESTADAELLATLLLQGGVPNHHLTIFGDEKDTPGLEEFNKTNKRRNSTSDAAMLSGNIFKIKRDINHQAPRIIIKFYNKTLENDAQTMEIIKSSLKEQFKDQTTTPQVIFLSAHDSLLNYAYDFPIVQLRHFNNDESEKMEIQNDEENRKSLGYLHKCARVAGTRIDQMDLKDAVDRWKLR